MLPPFHRAETPIRRHLRRSHAGLLDHQRAHNTGTWSDQLTRRTFQPREAPRRGGPRPRPYDAAREERRKNDPDKRDIAAVFRSLRRCSRSELVSHCKSIPTVWLLNALANPARANRLSAIQRAEMVGFLDDVIKDLTSTRNLLSGRLPKSP
jgi:hypothetical protein